MSTHSKSDIQKRKKEHLSLCVNPAHKVESGSTRLDEVHLIHKALPNIQTSDISTEVEFLSHRLSFPLMISPMTGGGEEGRRINRELIMLAAEENIAVSTGSIRVLFYKEDMRDHFDLKALAPHIPFITNLAAVQLMELEHARIIDVLSTYQFDAVSIHLNALQEYFQEDGDRNFCKLTEQIAEFCNTSPIPVIVKETGFGIDLASYNNLMNTKVYAIDLAAAGGTNWVLVEGLRNKHMEACAQEFTDWGSPLAMLLLALQGRDSSSHAKLIASGGLRNGMDVLKALVLGANCTAMALPLLRVVYEGGREAGKGFVKQLRTVVCAGMLALGCRDIAELRSAPHWISATLEHDVNSFIEASIKGESLNRLFP